MEFGRLAGNDRINERIYDHFRLMHRSDVAVFVRKFRSESDSQRFHTYRELILGSYLRGQGWNVRYGREIAGKTPDWVLEDASGGVREILDVMTLHQRRETDVAISQGLATNQTWSGWITIPPEHIYSKIQEKAVVYSSVVRKRRLPYVVGVFGEFTASMEPREVERVVYDLHGGVFRDAQFLAGLIYFRERSGEYEFFGYPNPDAAYPSEILHHGSHPPLSAGE